MEHKYWTLSNSTCINPVLEKGGAVLRASKPENTGQLCSFIETCGFSDEIYFKLSKHFRAALMTAQRRCCIWVQFTNRSSLGKWKLLWQKNCVQCIINGKRVVAVTPAQLVDRGVPNAGRWSQENHDLWRWFSFSCIRKLCGLQSTSVCMLGGVHLFVWVFGNHRCRHSVLTNVPCHHPKSSASAGKFTPLNLLSSMALQKAEWLGI